MTGEPVTTIFIPSFIRDFVYLKACLASIDKFASGFYEVMVDVPSQDYDLFKPLLNWDNKITPHSLSNHSGETQHNGPLWQQIVKIRADQMCASHSHILYMDSDCVFVEPVRPSDYFKDKKLPVLCIIPWELARQDEQNCWRETTRRTMGFDCPYLCMCRHPAVHYPELLAEFRLFVEQLHGQPFNEYVLSQKADFPPGFSEFCSLGAFAWKFWHDKYHWIDLSKEARPKDKIHQGWGVKGLRQQDIEVWKRLGLV